MYFLSLSLTNAAVIEEPVILLRREIDVHAKKSNKNDKKSGLRHRGPTAQVEVRSDLFVTRALHP